MQAGILLIEQLSPVKPPKSGRFAGALLIAVFAWIVILLTGYAIRDHAI